MAKQQGMCFICLFGKGGGCGHGSHGTGLVGLEGLEVFGLFFSPILCFVSPACRTISFLFLPARRHDQAVVITTPLASFEQNFCWMLVSVCVCVRARAQQEITTERASCVAMDGHKNKVPYPKSRHYVTLLGADGTSFFIPVDLFVC